MTDHLSPRRFGWQPIAEDRRHPRHHETGDVVYHTERGVFAFLVYRPAYDNYETLDMTADDCRQMALAAPEGT